ncbi:hypothetical protein CF327_g7057 [Tilletia walkeri]|uniref:Serine/threonine-protein phosphatase 2A activator n=1 Tax=Tilletia walkeri TaxID=117179 RepID=A0A8X7N396_9BASI|nr:hypothetical protein CF327_g7057 [Tilletia walkeri]KAE8265246.1 hypothetical protein A4X09_0g6710 [Tilletia walkeri]
MAAATSTAQDTQKMTSDAQRDALAALLRRPSKNSGSSSSSSSQRGPPQPPAPAEKVEEEDTAPPTQAPVGTPRPMPFDPSIPPPSIDPFTLPSAQDLPPPPRKRILTPTHLAHFLTSQTHTDLLSFLRQGAASIVGVQVPADVQTPEPSPIPAAGEGEDKRTGIQSALGLLNTVAGILASHPPHAQNQGGTLGSGSASAQGRFGNPTFRNFHAEISARSDELHSQFFHQLREEDGDGEEERKRKKVARTELKAYFDEAWGNARRIDYGSGMELNFVCWLLILYKLGIFNDSVPSASSSSSDSLAPLAELGPDVFLRVFWSYILLMRRIQATYFLEPAGSHGVWGLDDYHFLPFLLGAAQLSDHPYLRPSSIHSTDIISPPSKYPSEYMYLSQIALLHSIKTIPSSSGAPSANSLRWHSPMLDDISSVKTWAQVEKGMWKMLEAEVVGKLPVAQHFLFGVVLPFPASDEDEVEVEKSACGHIHQHQNATVVRDAQGKALPRPTGHSHVHGGADVASNTVDAPQQGGTTGWGDCCGIPIPSAYGAAAAAAAAAAEEAGNTSTPPTAPVEGKNGGIVAETGQLGRAKGWSASPAALASGASLDGEQRRKEGSAAAAAAVLAASAAVAGGVRRIPFD